MKVLKQVLTVASLSVLLVACGKNNIAGSAGAPVVNGKEGGSVDSIQTNGVSGAESFSGQSFGGGASATAEMQGLQKVIYFGFDKYSLDTNSKSVLNANAAYLMKHPDVHLLIAGHTDPRGSQDYNFHLGQRRADAALNYLMKQGVSSGQMCTVSYGELRPAATPAQFKGDWRKAYRLDRRDELKYNQTCEGQK